MTAYPEHGKSNGKDFFMFIYFKGKSESFHMITGEPEI